MAKHNRNKSTATSAAENNSSLTLAAKNGKTPILVDTTASNSVEIDYFRFYESLLRKEIIDWQQARMLRRDPFYPSTYHIQQLYKDAMLDNHLQGAIENRILRVINKEFILKDAEGKIDRKRSALVQTRWCRHLVRKYMESMFYGYSICFISGITSGVIRTIKDIPRENIIPEKGLILKNPMLPKGESIAYAEFPDTLIYMQMRSDAVGILERLAPLTIYKRHSWASWDEFEQIFGVPIRIAKTMINTTKHKDELQGWLQTMGRASYGIFDKQTDIEIKESGQKDAFNVFMQKIQAINKELSKGTLGQTMTMDDGSSQSQATVHQQTYDDITSADIMEIQDWFTDDMLPVLRNLGYDIPEGFYLQLQEKETIKPQDQIKIDQVLGQLGFNLDAQYVEEFYGTKLDKTTPKSEPKATNPLSFFA